MLNYYVFHIISNISRKSDTRNHELQLEVCIRFHDSGTNVIRWQEKLTINSSFIHRRLESRMDLWPPFSGFLNHTLTDTR
jgi:hypothetical protein